MTNQDVPAAELSAFALELGCIAGDLARRYFRQSLNVENKDRSGFDPVTDADRAIEHALRETLRDRFPDHGIVGEEEDNCDGASLYRWYIDPIDGTRSFMMGSPLWGTLIGLTRDEVPILGVMCQPVLDEMFLGTSAGTMLIKTVGRSSVHASSCRHLQDAVLTSTHPDMFSGKTQTAVEALRGRCLLDRYGGDCYNYAMLAAGFVDLVVESGLKPFDIVPLIPVIEGAGAVVTNWLGDPPLAGGDIVAAATPELHAKALAVLRDF